MKKLYFILFLICFGFGLNAQVINFPDANFKARILLSSPNNYLAKNLTGQYFKVDANNNGEIEVDEALQVSFLNVSNANISSLDQLSHFTNLKFFYCRVNNISNLNLNDLLSLEQIACSNNLLTELNLDGLVNLQYAECDSNQISSLNLISNTNLTYLSCNMNMISSLDVSQITSLQQLNCSNNNMVSLNVSGLEDFDILNCSNNLLTNLDIAGLGLIQLNCSNNQLSYLNLAGMQLGQFNCSNNQFVSLDLSQVINVSNFYCANNQLTELNLNNCANLQYLDCSNNLITTLNFNNLVLPTGCIEGCPATFILSNNNLQTLFVKSARTDINLTFNGNPNIQYICTNDSQIAYVQGRVNNHGYTNCQVNSYCSFTPGGVFYTIQGNSRYDVNGDGCDASDINLPSMRFNLSNGTVSGSVIPGLSGSYSIPVGSGNHTMTPVFENPSYFNVFPASITVAFPAVSSPFVQDFCITPNGIHNDLEITILPMNVARPGFDSFYKIIYKNKGTHPKTGNVTLTFEDAILDYIASSPLYTSQTTNTLSWDYANLLPFETREIQVSFNVNSPMEIPPVNIGDQLDFSATISPIVNDEIPLDNTSELKQNVVGSYDPNDKTCVEGTTVSTTVIGEFVHYLIRFENTGNYPAENVVVKDMIDLTKFDIATLVPISSSHSMVARFTYPNKIEFIFEDINLPFDDANNDGYVAFKVKTKSTLVVGNTFSNTANIYFDYNPPIITNTAATTIQTLANSDFEFSNYFTLFPNPVKEVLSIESQSAIEIKTISVYNVLGQLVLVVPNAVGVASVDVTSLNAGTYFIKINSDKGTSSGKFIKE